MNNHFHAPVPPARFAPGLRTAVLILALGAVALVAEVTMVMPQATPLTGPANVPAAVADSSVLPAIEIPMIAWDRPSASDAPAVHRPVRSVQRPLAVDPSVPPADSVVATKAEPLPATF